jgi:hypothetical protein
MNRYHIKVYIPANIKSQLKSFTDNLNTKKWLYSRHSIENLKYRNYNIKEILFFVKDLKLDYKNIFEIYTDDKNYIIKVCYRIKYKNFDIILVINKDKKIITIYTNAKNDKHYTLNKTLYNKGN